MGESKSRTTDTTGLQHGLSIRPLRTRRTSHINRGTYLKHLWPVVPVLHPKYSNAAFFAEAGWLNRTRLCRRYDIVSDSDTGFACVVTWERAVGVPHFCRRFRNQQDMPLPKALSRNAYWTTPLHSQIRVSTDSSRRMLCQVKSRRVS